MSIAESLYRLQTLDLRIESLRQALRAAEQQLGESSELRAARAAAAEQARALHEAEIRQRDLELALGQTENQLREVEDKLYSGRVTNPKELQSWQRDAAQLRERKSRYEDQLLGAMEDVETGRAALRAAEQRLAAVEEAWRRSQAELQEQIARLKNDVANAERERATLATTIPESPRITYERLRRERGGRAVARVEQSTCQGCRLALPAALVQRARVSTDLVYCGSCGRHPLGTALMATLRLHADGAARGNPGPAAAAFILLDGERELTSGSRYLGRRTNNEAEYEALVDGLRTALAWHPSRLEVFLDSELLVEQLRGRYRVRSARLLPLWQEARELLARFPDVEIRHVRRSANHRADALANAVLDAHRPQDTPGPL